MSEPTFTISADWKAITCKICGLTSHNPNDVAHHYCARCRVFHDVPGMRDEAELIEATRDHAKKIAGKLPAETRFVIITWQPLAPGPKYLLGTTFASNVKNHAETVKVLGLLLEKLKAGLPKDSEWK